jgi:hypothetical protein
MASESALETLTAWQRQFCNLSQKVPLAYCMALMHPSASISIPDACQSPPQARTERGSFQLAPSRTGKREPAGWPCDADPFRGRGCPLSFTSAAGRAGVSLRSQWRRPCAWDQAEFFRLGRAPHWGAWQLGKRRDARVALPPNVTFSTGGLSRRQARL